MEEMMIKTTMMMIKTSENPISIPTSLPTWKLYENPFFTSPPILQNPTKNHDHLLEDQEEPAAAEQENKKQIHRLHLPVSSRKIAASFWDLSFIKPFMESELDTARAEIIELKNQLECERKARKKMESANKRLSKELSGERKGREALEKVCQELAQEISTDQAELSRLRREMEEERKMLRVAEVLREERVQMKLNEAKILLEEKLLELEAIKRAPPQFDLEPSKINNIDHEEEEPKRNVLEDESSNNNGGIKSMAIQRRMGNLEPENPHIKRGIKGFVEFPKVVQAIGLRSRHLGTKLECQKAQMMILLKHKSLIRSNNLIMS